MMGNRIIWLVLSALLCTGMVKADDGGPVCYGNDYALCSHAQCTCVNESGADAPCTTGGLARCECPVVKYKPVKDGYKTMAYNANFGTLDCAERCNPQNQSALPAFAKSTAGDTPAVYSEYSYGDSLDGNRFGTLSKAELLVCKDLPHMTDCLDAPCTIGADGKAICYCLNTVAAVDQTVKPWNTLGGDCKHNRCQLAPGQIWSAAYIADTQKAIQAIADTLETDKTPKFCKSEETL